MWPWASWCGVRSSSTEEAGGHLGLILIEELRAQVECGMFLKLRTHGVYHKRTPPSPVPCPEVFTGHCIYVSSHLPPPSTSSFKIIWWFCRSFFQKKCIIFICKIDTKCKIPKRGGVVLRHKEKPLALCVLSCFLADGGATAPAHWAGHLGTHTSPGPSLLTSETTLVFGFRSSLSCCIAFIETTQGPQGTHTWCHGIRGSQPQNGGLLSQPPAVPTKGQAPLCALPGMEDSIIRYKLLCTPSPSPPQPRAQGPFERK